MTAAGGVMAPAAGAIRGIMEAVINFVFLGGHELTPISLQEDERKVSRMQRKGRANLREVGSGEKSLDYNILAWY